MSGHGAAILNPAKGIGLASSLASRIGFPDIPALVGAAPTRYEPGTRIDRRGPGREARRVAAELTGKIRN